MGHPPLFHNCTPAPAGTALAPTIGRRASLFISAFVLDFHLKINA